MWSDSNFFAVQNLFFYTVYVSKLFSELSDGFQILGNVTFWQSLHGNMICMPMHGTYHQLVKQMKPIIYRSPAVKAGLFHW